MTKPDTLIAGAKKLSAASGIPWAPVSRIYSSLQGANLLPTSVGRRVWHAKPEHIATLLIGVALGEIDALPERVTLLSWATKNGSGFEGDNLLTALSRLLTDAEAAASVRRVVLEVDLDQATIESARKPTIYTAIADEGAHPSANAMIQHRAVINGAVFRALAESVAWQLEEEGEKP